jgi:hypothetical protein
MKKVLADKPSELIAWSANSPDLNPIEKCWKYMKEKLKDKDTGSDKKFIMPSKCSGPPTSPGTISTLKNLSVSMPRRIQKVLVVKGNAISY